MQTETKQCQNCKKDFVIESEDFNFYEKMKVPAPTFCPDCRFQRRMAWRNAWHIFKKTEERTGKKIFSFFPEESRIKIYDRDFWWSDGWDAMEYGKDYDWQRPFFEQIRELMEIVPQPAISVTNMVNCSYCSNVNNIKNCYLVRASSYSEDSAYLVWDHASKLCMDSHMTDQCESSYGNVNVLKSFKTLFSVDCGDCTDVVLSKDCVGCNNCFGCVGLRKKSYCFFNEQLSKEEYEKKLAEVDIRSYKAFSDVAKKAYNHWKTFPSKYIHGRMNVSVSGDYIFESKNTKNCFRVRECEDVKYCQNILSPTKDCYDYSNWGDRVELLYECLVCGLENSRLRFCLQCYPGNRELEYSIFCQKSSYLFGCVGLKNKQYCIFNKQFTKEEYEALVPKLRQHMNDMPYTDVAGRVYRYGEFFPPEFSPFPYQISEAAEFFPYTEAEVKERGLQWYAIQADSYTPTVKTAEIPDSIDEVSESITAQIIECQHNGTCGHECPKAFRVTADEVKFCKRLGIPLARLCPNCRQYERLGHRNPSSLWKRHCQCVGVRSENSIYTNQVKHPHENEECPNEFETSYAPDREEIVYCEQCYQAEVA